MAGAQLRAVEQDDVARCQAVPGERLDGVPREPTIAGRELRWTDVDLAAASRSSLVLLLAVGAGVSEGEYVNRAQAIEGATDLPLSGEATARVRVVPDPTFDCTDVLGKVYDDANRNGTQDFDEAGIPGVRLATARGLLATTDQYGRFHITCAITPREGRGSNFVLKLDDRTLPTGFRGSTELLPGDHVYLFAREHDRPLLALMFGEAAGEGED